TTRWVPRRSGLRRLADPHREIDGADILGQRAGGDVIDPGGGDGGQGVAGDAAGDLQRGPPGGQPHRLLHGRQVEVVQQDLAGAGGQGLARLVQVFHLDLDVVVDGAGAFQGGRDAAGRGDMVFLDQDGVV